MKKLIFIIGGARSGKSSFALEVAKKEGGKVAFIATCEPKDKEMKKRIALHKAARPKSWTTFEVPCDMDPLLKNFDPSFKTILIDCLTLWVSNLVLKNTAQEAIETKALKMLACLKKTNAIIVSNEVGLGIVPDNELARLFRDIAGRINQIVARQADEVYFMISGIPLKIK